MKAQIFRPKPENESLEAVGDKARERLRIYAISIGRRDLAKKIMAKQKETRMRESISISFYQELNDGQTRKSVTGIKDRRVHSKSVVLRLSENGKEVVRLAGMPEGFLEQCEALLEQSKGD